MLFTRKNILQLEGGGGGRKKKITEGEIDCAVPTTKRKQRELRRKTFMTKRDASIVHHTMFCIRIDKKMLKEGTVSTITIY